MRQMYVYAPDGSLHKGADGWIALCRVLDGLRWAGKIGGLPGIRALARLGYRAIAARRYRLSCRGAACRIPGSNDPPGGGKPPTGAAAREILLILTLGLAAAATALQGCAAAPNDPRNDKLLAIADPQAAEVLAATFEAYGGLAAWSSRRNVEYDYRLEFYGGAKSPQKVTRQRHRLGLGGAEQIYLEDLDVAVPQIVRIDGEALQVTRGGAPLTDPADLDFPRAFGQIARSTFMNPWNLTEPECRLEFRGERIPASPGSVPAGLCFVIRLRFDRGGKEGTSTDWQDFYISRLSHLVDRVHTYRAEDADYRVSIWSDHRTFGDLRVATRRATYASDVSGALGTLEVVAEYSNVQFDAPFTDDVFRAIVPLAASASRE